MPTYVWADEQYVNLRDGSTYDPKFRLMVDEPTAANTGPRVTPTNVMSETVTLTTGQVFSGNIVNGRIVIPLSATGVIIIEDNLVDASALPGTTELIVIDVHVNTGATVIIRHNEIRGRVGAHAIGVRRYTAYRNDIHHVEDTFRVHTSGGVGAPVSDTVIEGNYVHDMVVRTPDPNRVRTDNRTHNDCVQIEGGSGTVIRGNAFHCMASTDGTSNIEWATNASPYAAVPAGTANARPHPQGSQVIACTTGISPITDLLIEGNWLYGGDFGINMGNDINITTTALVKDNRFDRMQWHATYAINIDSSDNTPPYRIVTDGNVHIDDGSPVTVRRNS